MRDPLPCPFCGSKTIDVRYQLISEHCGVGHHVAQCRQCGSRGPVPTHDKGTSIDQAILNWNLRGFSIRTVPLPEENARGCRVDEAQRRRLPRRAAAVRTGERDRRIRTRGRAMKTTNTPRTDQGTPMSHKKISGVRAPRLTVKVTAQVIEAAKKADSAHCMIAEAIRKQLPWAHNISVDTFTIRFSDLKKRRRYFYRTPQIGQDGIVQFDQGLTPKPFSMNLRADQITPIAHRSESAKAKRRQTDAKRRRRRARIMIKGGGASNPTGELIVDGGTAPPLQRTIDDPLVPVSRRREFGRRILRSRWLDDMRQRIEEEVREKLMAEKQSGQ